MTAAVPLVLLLGVLAVAWAGLHQLVVAAGQRRALVERTALDEVEARASRLMSRLDARLRRTEPGRRLARRLAGAGVPFTAAQFGLGVTAAAALVFVLARTVVAPLFAALLAAGTVRMGWAWVKRKQDQRREVFVNQLPEVARVLSNAASAGLAIRTAIEMAAAELADPAATEMRLTAESLRLGRSVDEALEDLEARLPSRELGVLVSTLVIQHRSGGGLVSALRNMADTLDDRKDLRREIRTLMAGSVFTGYVVVLIGVGTLVLLNTISPGLLDQMTSSGVGRLAFLASGSLYAVGLLLIRRMTRIEA